MRACVRSQWRRVRCGAAAARRPRAGGGGACSSGNLHPTGHWRPASRAQRGQVLRQSASISCLLLETAGRACLVCTGRTMEAASKTPAPQPEASGAATSFDATKGQHERTDTGGGGGDDDDADVLVIGAGAAGLAAAAELARAGLHVQVLEARERVGGRVHSVQLEAATADGGTQPRQQAAEVVVDAGAAWLHKGDDPAHPTALLAKHLGLHLARTDWDSATNVVFDRDGLVAGAAAAAAETATAGVLARAMVASRAPIWAAAAAAGGGDDSEADVSLGAAIEAELSREARDSGEERLIRSAIHDAIVNDYAAPLDQLSCLYWDADLEMSGEADYLIGGGYGRVVGALGSELGEGAIVLGAEVTAIDCTDSRGRAQVRWSRRRQRGEEGEGEQVVSRARAVVVSVPLGVLQSGSICFEPALPPPKLSAIGRLGMGLLNKVILQFEQRWWPADVDVFSSVVTTFISSETRTTCPPHRLAEPCGCCLACVCRYLPPSEKQVQSDAAGDAASRDDAGTSGCALAQWLIVNCVSVTDDVPVLMALVAPPYSWQMEAQDDGAIVDAFLRHVARPLADSLPCWGPAKQLPPLTAQHITRWGSDPLSRGSYSYIPVGASPADRTELRRALMPADGRPPLFFCGEACHALFPSTVHGAYLSGVDAAQRLSRCLGVKGPPLRPAAVVAAAAAAAAGCDEEEKEEEGALAVLRTNRAAATAPTFARPLRPAAHSLSWGQLTGEERAIAAEMGYKFSSWDAADTQPSATDKSWAQLSARLRTIAKALGYSASTWDEESSSSGSD
jgi:monoamine oxidase